MPLFYSAETQIECTVRHDDGTPVDFTYITDAWVTFADNNTHYSHIFFEKRLSDGDITIEDNVLKFTITHDEAELLPAEENIYWQIKLSGIDGDEIPSKPYRIAVYDLLDPDRMG